MFEQFKGRVGLCRLPEHALSLAQEAVLVELAELVGQLIWCEYIIPDLFLLKSQEFANGLLIIFINLQ